MRNSKISFWYKQGLVALLLAACAMAAVGVSMARYQTDVTGSAVYEVSEPGTVKLWAVDEGASAFITDNELAGGSGEWVTKGGVRSLSFAVSNGDTDDYCEDSQGVNIRLFGTLGIEYTDTAVVELTVMTANSEIETYEAVAKRIIQGSPYYASFGGGWVFEFQDEFGEEMCWVLPGGEFSSLMAEISLEGFNMSDNALLQLQVESVPVS